ncbi:MAG: PEP-CTERM sorting domain-containing protein [Bryobacterales bacterium]|nr:PEP-CTERM sorting domain-containing protein [Bryobacterales bacterium]
MKRAAVLALLLAAGLPAATIQFVSIEGFLHYGGSTAPQAAFNSSSPEFTSFLDANNLGVFQFVWTNTTGIAIDNLTFTLFLDPDIDRDDNTYFNEYGEFLSNLLPILAPSGAFTFTDWEIDEPEYTFGNIYTHANEAALDNTSGVPASGPVDDVSQAMLFRVGQLLPGQTLTVAGTLSLTDAAGLGHYDPDSDVSLYVNGYATLSDAPTSGVPEPATAALVAAATLAAVLIRRK